jgi:hypothetical protein
VLHEVSYLSLEYNVFDVSVCVIKRNNETFYSYDGYVEDGGLKKLY